MDAPHETHDSGIFRRIVTRPIGAMVILISLVVLGVIAYTSLPLQLLPGGIQGNRFSVWVDHPGSSANENEDKVARILEEEFRTLPDLENLFSRASDGSARVRVQFKHQGDLELAKAELRDRIERARPRLPETVERIHVWSNDDGEPPILVFILMVDPGDGRSQLPHRTGRPAAARSRQRGQQGRRVGHAGRLHPHPAG